MFCYHCMTRVDDPSQPYCQECGNRYDIHYSQSHELAAGMTLSGGRYIVGKCIGSGGFGISYVGIDLRMMKKVLIKETFYRGIFHRNSYDRSSRFPFKVTYGDEISFDEIMMKTQKECGALSNADDLENIVKVYDCFPENNTAYIVTEFIEGIKLSEKVKSEGRYTWEDLYPCIKPLMQSLAQLHHKGILHRDIKPQNIMIRDSEKFIEEFVLIDFGLARSTNSQTISSMGISFTPGYSPFEQRTLIQKDGTYTDVYSLAATVYFALSGEHPKEEVNSNIDVIFPKLCELHSDFDVPQNVVSALRYALNPDSRARCQSVDELIGLFDGRSKTVCEEFNGEPANVVRTVKLQLIGTSMNELSVTQTVSDDLYDGILTYAEGLSDDQYDVYPGENFL